METLHKIRFSAIGVVVLLAAATTAAAGPWLMEGRKPSPKKEQDLIAVLRSKEAKAKKADACKDLSVYGSAKAVPELAKLLSDEQLASWARIALEAIPGSASDEALRKAADSLQGQLLVGVINSIGVRRDAAAVGSLAKKLQDKDAAVASAAAAALGRIGNSDATKSLQQALAGAPPKVRSTVAEGLVLCAERSLSEGHNAQAAEIYDQVRKAAVPKQRILEATRGAILAREDAGIPLLLEQLRSHDKVMFQMALGTAREFPGKQVDQALAAELDRATPEHAALVIQAMADRKDTVILPVLIIKAATHGPQPVRVAAVSALGRVGNPLCLTTLVEIALESDATLAKTAKTALFELPGQDVDKEIVARLKGAQGKMYPLLIEVVGERRIKAVDDLVKALADADDTVRRAALTALGTTVPADKLSILIDQAVAPKHEKDAAVAQKALKVAAVRMGDRETCSKKLAAALNQASVPTKIVLLKILAAVGGTEALAAVGSATKGNIPEVQDAGSRLLGEWMTIDAAPVLLDLAKTGPNKYRVRALRGYIRIARQFVMEEQPRLEMCQNAFQAAVQPAEQKLVLDVLKRYPNLETLKFAVKVTKDVPAVHKEASQASLEIARKLTDEKHSGLKDDVRQILSQAKLDKVKLEIVKAEYGAGAKQKDVTKTLQKQATGLQLISLPGTGFAVAFGGDPVPGTAKHLKIWYRIDGKEAEASFPENSLVILPMPK